MTKDCYDKPVWTVSTLAGVLPALPGHLLRVAPTLVGRPISGAWRERVMLAVAAENRCVYCQLAHDSLGRAAGLSTRETRRILEGREAAQDRQQLVERYVRDLARRGFRSRDEALYEELGRFFTPAQRAAIESSAHVMNFANRFGNTFDAARARLDGCDETPSTTLDQVVVSSLFLTVAAVVAPAIGVLKLAQAIRD